MPNNITNRIQMIGTDKQIKAVLKKYSTFYPAKQMESFGGDLTYTKKTDGDGWDEYGWFNKETNMFSRRGNDGLYEVEGIPEGFEPHMEQEFTRFPDFNKVIKMPKVVVASFDTLGIDPLWYGWSCDNWGTKWNSYSHKKEDENTHIFETAWSSVPKILEEMSRSFPDVEFLYEWADEDTSYNAGTAHYKDGLMDLNSLEDGSLEAYELYFKLNPEDKKYYKFVEGNYEYDEDTEWD